MSNYTKNAVRKNSFVETVISLEDVIGVSSIDEIWENTLDVGNHFYEYKENEIYEFENVKDYIIKEFTLSKKEIETTDFLSIVQRVLSEAYRNNYENDLYDDYFNHIEDVLDGYSFQFEGLHNNDSVHFSNSSYIRVALTKNQFAEKCSEYKENYDTLTEFYDDADDIMSEHIGYIEKYDIEHFDYWGNRIDTTGWESLVCDNIDLLEVRKAHQNHLKSLIKNRVPLIYREQK